MTWRAAAPLARRGGRSAGESTRRDPADLPDEPERLLDSPTYEGFPIRPLYTALDALPEPPLPGSWPFIRGADAHRDVLAGWKVAETFPAVGWGGAVADGNAGGADRAERRGERLVLRVGEGGVAPPISTACSRVYLELAPVIVDAGAEFTAAAEAVLALVAGADDAKRAADVHRPGRRPLTAPLADRAAPSAGEVVAVAAKPRAGPGPGRHRRRAGLAQPGRQRGVGARRARSARRWTMFGCWWTPGWTYRMRCARSVSGWSPMTTSS